MTDLESMLSDRVWQYLRDHRWGPSISLAGLANGVGASMAEVSAAADELVGEGLVVVTRYESAPWSYRAVERPRRQSVPEPRLEAGANSMCCLHDNDGPCPKGSDGPEVALPDAGACARCGGMDEHVPGSVCRPEAVLPTCPSADPSLHEWPDGGRIIELAEEVVELRAALERFVTFHSGHALGPELAPIQAEARKALGHD